MVFVNERTYLNAVETGATEEFHRLYEEAVDKIAGTFGKEHPNYIGGREMGSKGGAF